jgi:adenylate cyclase
MPLRCRAAAAAIGQARLRLAAINATREDEPLAITTVLHAGSLAYGNVGARERLDFTVIGPAINVASRLEAKAKELGEPTVATAEVAVHLGDFDRSLGVHVLRGVSTPVEIFAPPAMIYAP